MTSDLPSRGQTVRPAGALAYCALFSLAMVTTYVVVALTAGLWNAPDRWLTAAVAAGICWLTGIAALGVAAAFRGPEMAMFNMLVGLLMRMFVPLAACAIIYARGSALADAGLAYYVLVFYMVSLAIETGFLVRQLHSFPTAQRG